MKKNEIKIRPEDEILLLCARSSLNLIEYEKLKFLTQNNIEWGYLVQIALKNKLIPFLYHNLTSICPKNVPSDVLLQLKNIFQEIIQKNLLLTGELIRVLNILKKNNIRVIAYKGPVLATLTYGNIAFRQFGDIDLLINQRDALIVKNIMVFNGYKLYPNINIDDSLFMRISSEISLFNENNGAYIEIKWKFAGNFFTFHNNPKILFEELNRVNINNNHVCTISTSNHLLILCVHCAKHYWNRLSWICDISELIKNQNINWTSTVEKAEKLGIKRILFINLFLARDLFGLNLPLKILNQIYDDPFVEKISFQIKRNIFFKQKEHLSIFDKLSLDLRKRENIFYAITDCIKILLKPNYKDFESIRLPMYLYGLYHLIRPFLLIKRRYDE